MIESIDPWGRTNVSTKGFVLTDTQSILKDNINAWTETIQSLDGLNDVLLQAADMVTTALNAGHKLLTCGNGGSAADAAHLATEFVVRFDQERRPYPAICLNASGSDLTAVGNDYVFEKAFERQVHAFGQQGDILIVFTTSGNSKNILLALEQANRMGLQSIAFLGKSGGQTKGLATVELTVPGTVTARIQEAQHLLLHCLCEIVETGLAKA